MIKNMLIFSEIEFLRHIFGKYQNVKFLENLSIGRRVIPCGRTDRHDEANCRFSKFCEAPKKK
jgi:hypothetical protein